MPRGEWVFVGIQVPVIVGSDGRDWGTLALPGGRRGRGREGKEGREINLRKKGRKESRVLKEGVYFNLSSPSLHTCVHAPSVSLRRLFTKTNYPSLRSKIYKYILFLPPLILLCSNRAAEP